MPEDSNKTILLLLRESAKNSRNEQYRKTARQCADKLEKYIDKFCGCPSYENMIEVNGLFALADRIMNTHPEDDGPDGGGKGDVWEAKHTEAVAA